MFYIINNEYMFFSRLIDCNAEFSIFPDDCPIFTDYNEASYFSIILSKLGYETRVVPC